MHVLRKWDIAILLSMGIGLSCWFWRFQAMPAPDFSTFLDVGRSLWHLRLPENMQRAPFYGLIIYPLSFLMPGPHAAWTAAMVLNAVLFPITLVLIYLVVRQYHERAAMWVACLAAINPFTLELMTRPLCETLLVFLVTLTLWLWRKHPGWAYLAACLATLVRPDVGGLILTVAVVDKSKWMVRMSHVILAAVPMVTWVLLARYTATDKGLVYYTQLLDPARWFEVQGWHSLAQTVVWPLPATVPVMVGLGLAICLSAWRAWPVMLFVGPYVLIQIG